MVFPARPKTHGPLPGVPGRVSVLPGIPRARSTYPRVPGITVPGGWIPAGILTARFGATGTLTATANQVSTVTAPFTAAAALTAAALGKGTANAAFTGSGQLSVGIVAVGGGFAVNAPFTASGTATGIAFSQIKRAADFTATGTANAGTVAREIRNAPFTGVGTLSATNFPRYAVAAAFTGVGTLSTGNIRVPVTAGFTAEALLSAIARRPSPNVTAYTSGSGRNNNTITLPVAATGDLRVVVIGLTAQSMSSSSLPGFTRLGEDSSWYDPGVAVFYQYKRALGTPDTVLISVSGYGSANTYVAMTIPGAMLPSIFTSARNNAAAASPHTSPAITTTKENTLVVRAMVGNPPALPNATYSSWGAPMQELTQQQSIAADSTGDNSVMTVATGAAATVGAQPAVTVNPSISMPYASAAVAVEPLVILAGMHLTTQHTLVSTSSQTQVAGWTADTNSTVTTERLVIPITVTGATVDVYLRYQTNTTVGSASFTWRLLKNSSTSLATTSSSGTGVGTNYEAVMTYTGNFVAGDTLYITCSGTFTAPAPYIIPGVDSFVRVSTPAFVGFAPSGMTKDVATMAMGTTSPTQITGVVAESGSTVSSNALVANTSGVTVVRGQVKLTGSYGSSYTAELRRNGTAIPGATVSGGDAMGGAPVLVIPATTVTITAGDLITIWITNPGPNCTIAAGTDTFVRLTAT